MHKLSTTKIEKYLDRIFFIGFCLLVLTVPLIFSRQSENQFALPKVTLFQIESIFLFSLWLGKILLSSEVRIKRVGMDIFVVLFVGLSLLSLVFSVHFSTSLFGRYGRYEGFLTFLNYAVLYFLAVQAKWDSSRLKILLQTLVASAGLIASYGLLQYLGYDFFKWEGMPFSLKRSFSTMGNPGPLSTYLAITLPLALTLTLTATQKLERFLWGGASLLIFVSLLTTFSRGGWLAAIVALLIFAFLYRDRLWEKQRILSLIFATFLGAVVIIGVFAAESPNPSTNLISRITSSTQIKVGSTATRLEIWKSALLMTKDRPLLGFGPDSFGLIYPQYATLKKAKLEGRSKVADHAHNYFLQLSSTLGIPATFVFLLIIGLMSLQGQKIVREKKEEKNFLLGGILSGTFAYLVSVFFTVNIVGSAFLFWIFLGLLSSQRKEKENTSVLGHNSTYTYSWSWRKKYFPLRVVSLGLIGIIAFYLSFLSLLFYIADVHFRMANDFYGQIQIDAADLQYQKAMKLNPYLDVYPSYRGQLYLEWVRLGGTEKDFEKAIFYLQLARQKNSLDFRTYSPLGWGYLFAARNYSPNYYTRAETILKQAIKLYPYYANFHYFLGSVYLDQGKHKKARSELKRAIQSDPRYSEAYVALGVCYEQTGRKKEAINAFEKALKINPSLEKVKAELKRLRK